jgi:hypothetical protein
MPGFDRTGPNGQGPKTGRAMGKCNPKKQNVDTSEDTQARGMGLGRRHRLGNGHNSELKHGRGRGLGRGRNANI